MKPIIIMLALFLPGVALGYVEIPLLQELICKFETSGGIKRGADGEIGYCQIKLGTARMLYPKHPAWRLEAALNNIEGNARIAQMVLRNCQQRGWKGVYGLAYCYNAGRSSGKSYKPEAHTYAMRMVTRYRVAKTKKDYYGYLSL